MKNYYSPIAGAKLVELCLNVVDLCDETAQFIANAAGKVPPNKISEKFHNNLVSHIDIQAEQQLVEKLQKLLPEAGFLTEENTIKTATADTYLRWIIDPLDGTTNFLHQVPIYAISVALLRETTPILGVVVDICRQETFWAVEYEGAYCNGSTIKVSKTQEMRHALAATGFPYYDFSAMDSYINVLRELINQTKGVRRLGSAAIDLCYVAMGRFDLFFEHSLQPWDVAAAALIVKEAGGKVGDFTGNKNWLFGKQIVAANPQLYPEIVALTKAQIW